MIFLWINNFLKVKGYSDSSIVEGSQSIIPHFLEYGLGSTNKNPRIGDLVVVHLRRTSGRKCRLVTIREILTEIDSTDPNRVKTEICFGKFRKVLKITTRHSTSMIPNDTQSQSQHSISQSY